MSTTPPGDRLAECHRHHKPRDRRRVGGFRVGGRENWQDHNIDELRAEMQANATDVLNPLVIFDKTMQAQLSVLFGLMSRSIVAEHCRKRRTAFTLNIHEEVGSPSDSGERLQKHHPFNDQWPLMLIETRRHNTLQVFVSPSHRGLPSLIRYRSRCTVGAPSCHASHEASEDLPRPSAPSMPTSRGNQFGPKSASTFSSSSSEPARGRFSFNPTFPSPPPLRA